MTQELVSKLIFQLIPNSMGYSPFDSARRVLSNGMIRFLLSIGHNLENNREMATSTHIKDSSKSFFLRGKESFSEYLSIEHS